MELTLPSVLFPADASQTTIIGGFFQIR